MLANKDKLVIKDNVLRKYVRRGGRKNARKLFFELLRRSAKKVS